jgi:hydroxymethylpyrimidine pyrophosphatase-like HAD family hydrolase
LTREGQVRLAATDLDGTLLRSDGSCSARTRAALAAVEAAGIQVVMVTARPPRWVLGLADLVGKHGLVLCSTGAFVYDVPSGQVVDEHCLAADDVGKIAVDLRNALPGIAFAVENRLGFGREHGYFDESVTLTDPSAETLEDLLDPLPGKLLARCDGMPSELFLQVVERVVGERAVVSYSGAVGLAEMGAVGVTKAVALAALCDSRGIDRSEVIAFGDMPNDLPMLAWAGRSYGVANGHPDVLDMVDEVCASNEDDGVAQVLEGLLAHAPHSGTALKADPLRTTGIAVGGDSTNARHT